MKQGAGLIRYPTVREARFYEKTGGNEAVCLTCERRCRVKEGSKGFCGTRINVDGRLYTIVYGDISSISANPIEKKPFFHFHPGSYALTVGAWSCNFSCPWCFLPDNFVVTNKGCISFKTLFKIGEIVKYKDGHISFVNNFNLETITHMGNSSRILKIFRHPYKGEIIKIKPFYLPEIRVTVNHKFFVFDRKNKEIREVSAKDLDKKHMLLVPKSIRLNDESEYPPLNIKGLLSAFKTKYRKARKVDREIALKILEFSSRGKTSREIGKLFNLHPTYVRKLLSNLRKHGIDFIKEYNENVIVEENGRVRFKTERRPGIPSEMVVDEDFASLLGYYCAEGYVTKSKRRPSSYSLVFSLGKNETELARKIIGLLTKLFGVNGRIVERRTNLEVTVYKTSLCRLFKLLAGEKSHNKKVPEVILRCENRRVINSFLKAYFEGDGYGTDKVVQFNSVSRELAINVFLLLMKLGFLPSFHEVQTPRRKEVEGRVVNQRNLYYVKINSKRFVNAFLNGLEMKDVKREKWNRFFESSDYIMVPISRITRENYKGYVYNLEVGNEAHSYLCNFVAVSNCQNYYISKNQPDPRKARYISPEQLVDIAWRNGCEGTSISFNEPTLMLEYSLDLFPLARRKGLYNTFVSNGYMTLNALEALAGAGLDAIKFDVKGDEQVYEKYCGGVKASVVWRNARRARELGLHVEIVNLVIPSVNDDEDCIRQLVETHIKELGADTPLHFTRYHPEYTFSAPPTPVKTLEKARELARSLGVFFPYVGNVPGHRYENTWCPKCGELLIQRLGFNILSNRITSEDKCPKCGFQVPLVR